MIFSPVRDRLERPAKSAPYAEDLTFFIRRCSFSAEPRPATVGSEDSPGRRPETAAKPNQLDIERETKAGKYSDGGGL